MRPDIASVPQHRIRRGRPDDAPFLPAIERSAGEIFRSLPDLAWIADDAVMPARRHAELIGAGTAWVATSPDDAPIGFLAAQAIDGDLHVWGLSVEHGAQGKGIGRALLAEAARCAIERGLRALTLTTFRNVPWNEPFYARLGFVTLDRRALTPHLEAVLRAEAAAGLPADRRGAMRLDLWDAAPGMAGASPAP